MREARAAERSNEEREREEEPPGRETLAVPIEMKRRESGVIGRKEGAKRRQTGEEKLISWRGSKIDGYPERYYVVPVRYYVVPTFFWVLWVLCIVPMGTVGCYRAAGYYGYCSTHGYCGSTHGYYGYYGTIGYHGYYGTTIGYYIVPMGTM